ncbi:MAG: nucleoside recognition domain-containing protein, partial [Pseudomonadales bacterium]
GGVQCRNGVSCALRRACVHARDRLTVYALFAAAFFPSNGQNIVFALYLIGIVVAVLSALAVRRHLLPETHSHFIIEMPPYHLPIMRNILLQTWQRLKGFVMRAGKAIVLVVIALNVVNSIGTDGSVGNENSEKSVLSAIGKSITPLFAPMGIEQDNWPATVGIFTGIFAKEVVVGTLDALYAPAEAAGDESIMELLSAAVASVPANLSELGDQLLDPLGLSLGDLQDLEAQAADQEVEINTITAMQALFNGSSGAFAYLLFILLYMPCVATIGVIYKEIGSFWAVFSVAWSFVIAYASAVVAYQLANIAETPLDNMLWILGVVVVAGSMFAGLIYWGMQSQRYELIDVKLID